MVTFIRQMRKEPCQGQASDTNMFFQEHSSENCDQLRQRPHSDQAELVTFGIW